MRSTSRLRQRGGVRWIVSFSPSSCPRNGHGPWKAEHTFTFRTSEAKDIRFPLLNKYYSGYSATITRSLVRNTILGEFGTTLPSLVTLSLGKENYSLPKDETTVGCWIDASAEPAATMRTLPRFDDVKDGLIAHSLSSLTMRSRKDCPLVQSSHEVHAAMACLVNEQIERLERNNYPDTPFNNNKLLRPWSDAKSVCSDEAFLAAIGELCVTHGQSMTRLLVETHAQVKGRTSAWVTLNERRTLLLTCSGSLDVNLPTFDLDQGFVRPTTTTTSRHHGDAHYGSVASISSNDGRPTSNSLTWNWLFRKWKNRFMATNGLSWDDPIFPTVKGVYTSHFID